MKKLLTVCAFTVVSACGGKKDDAASPPATPTTAPVACESTTDNYGAAGMVTWTALKNTTFPVVGQQAATGTVSIPPSPNGVIPPLTGNTIRMQLAFNPTPSTGVEIRNNRIYQYIFGQSALGFEATYVKSIAGSKDSGMPAPGETANVLLSGVFYIAGGHIPLDVPVYISAIEEGSYLVQSQGAGLTLDLRSQLNVGKGLDDMMALVNATVDPKLSVQFAVTLKKACDK